MVDTLTTSNFNFSLQESVYHGKVRDVYYLKNNLVVMVASDRISAFDVVLPKGIPFKGQVLNLTSAWWFEQTKNIIELKNNKDNLDKKLLPNIPIILIKARLPQVKISR